MRNTSKIALKLYIMPILLKNLFFLDIGLDEWAYKWKRNQKNKNVKEHLKTILQIWNKLYNEHA